MVLAGILFFRSGTDQAKPLKIEYLCAFSCFLFCFLQNGSFEQIATKCAILPNVYLLCFRDSKCLLLFRVSQHYIKITNLSKIIYFFAAVFKRTHENLHAIFLNCFA